MALTLHHKKLRQSAWALTVFCTLGLTWLTALNAAAKGPVQHDIILLLDNSGSMVRTYNVQKAPITPYDPNQSRIRFSRFLVRLLQASQQEDTAVGAALFAAEVKGSQPLSSTVVMAPLTDALAWTAADVTAIHQESCPPADAVGPDGQPLALKAGRDFCYGTRYEAAFSWAAQQLQGPPCGSTTRRCDILVFTDGDLNEQNSDSDTLVERSLQRLASQGIDVSVILFSDPGEEPKSLGGWRKWQQAGKVAAVETYRRSEPVRQLYEKGLRALGLETLLAGFTAIELPEERAILAADLPLNVSSLSLDLINDAPISDTYNVTPNLSIDRTRWWTAPAFSVLTGAFQGSGLLYYRALSATVPVEAIVTLLPVAQVEGKPVAVQVFARAGTRALDSSVVRIMALIEPAHITIPLTFHNSGVWRGDLPLLQTGAYTVTALVQATNAPISGTPEARGERLEIGLPSPPKALLSVSPSTVFAERPFDIELHAEGEEAVVALWSKATATAVIATFGSLDLQPDGKGQWHGRRAIPQPGLYPIRGQIERAGVVITMEPVSVTVLAYPQIQISAPVTEAMAGATITATVTISPPYSLTPTVWVREGWQRKRLEPDAVQRVADGVFRVVVVMPARRDLQIGAEVTGQNVEGARLETIQETVSIAVLDTSSAVGWATLFSPQFLIPGLMVILGVAVAARVWRDPRRRFRRLDDKTWVLVDKLSTEKNWREIEVLADRFRGLIDL